MYHQLYRMTIALLRDKHNMKILSFQVFTFTLLWQLFVLASQILAHLSAVEALIDIYPKDIRLVCNLGRWVYHESNRTVPVTIKCLRKDKYQLSLTKYLDILQILHDNKRCFQLTCEVTVYSSTSVLDILLLPGASNVVIIVSLYSAFVNAKDSYRTSVNRR